MKVLVKLGGTLLDNEETRGSIARQIAAAIQAGHQLTVVHGGGKQMTRFLAERGVESKFINGLRVTTPDVIDAVLKVFAGSVNHQLVAELGAAGVAAVGLTGIDAWLVEAEPLSEELGAVGKPVKANAQVLDTLNAGGFLPVVACVAGDRAGRVFNVNADQMAVACASGYRSSQLLFLTDVDGVRGADSAIISQLNISECQNLIATGVATGGMQAKLNAACDAITGGVPSVRIAQGAAPDVIARLLAGESLGTRIVG